MRLGFFQFQHCAAAMAIAVSAAWVGEVRAADGRPIEFSPIEDSPAGSTPVQIGSPQAGRVTFRDRVAAPTSFDFRSAPSDFAPMPSTTTIFRSKNRRQLEKLGPLTPEDLINNYIATEILKNPNTDSERDGTWHSLLERFNEQLWRGRGDTNALSGSGRSDSRDERNGWRWSGLRNRSASSESGVPSLKSMFTDSDAIDEPIDRPLTLSDMFAPKRDVDSVAQAVAARKAQQEQVNAFKRVFDAPPPARSDLQVPTGLAAAPPPTVSGWAGSTPPSAFGTAPGLAPPSFMPGQPSAPTAASVLSATAPPGFPQIQPAPTPTRPTQPQPVFSVPQRRF